MNVNNYLYIKLCRIITMIVFMAAIMGCNDIENRDYGNLGQENEKDLIYEGEELSFDGIKGDVATIYVVDDRIYFNTYEQDEQTEVTENFTEEGMTKEIAISEGEAVIQRLYSAMIDGNDVKEIPLVELKEDERIVTILVDRDSNIVLILEDSNNQEKKTSFIIVKTDQKGRELNRKDISYDIDPDADIARDNIFFDDKGRMIIVLNQEVCVFDNNYNFLCQLEMDEYVDNVAMTKDGHFICGGKNGQGAYIKQLDIDNKKWGKETLIGIEYFSGSDSLINGCDYDFYYKDHSGIYGYDIINKTSVKLMDFMASDVELERVYRFLSLEGEQFIAMSTNQGGKTEIMKYKKRDLSISEDKKVVTYGTLEIDADIRDAVVRFNKENKNYRVEFKDYSLEEEPIAKMNMDIMAGDVPDIIDLSGMSVKQYILKGMLEDLTPYMEKDTEIKETDMVDSVWNAMKIDDRVYYVAPSFSVSTLVARTKDVGTETGWTFDDMKQVLKKKDKKTRPFAEENIGMLYILMNYRISDFIDWDTGKCYFNSEEFREILEFCNVKGGIELDNELNYSSLVKDGKVLFVNGDISLGMIQVYKKMYDDDITLIGYPSEDKEGSYFNFNNMTGIYSKSKNKEGAWEFVRTLISKEYQMNEWKMNDIPTRKDCFEIKIKKETAKEKYNDEYGDEIIPADFCWSYENFEVQIVPASNEDVRMYRKLIDNTKKVGECNDFILEIILEEAEAYFNEDKNADQTIEIIQNRVETYVNENR